MKKGFLALLFLLVTRLIAMAVIPLNETTEARYGEIARKMLETGNWVTLLHDYNIPFLAKPPLSTWLSAASMGVFGVNELAVRLPSLLLSIGVVWLIGYTAFIRSGREAAMVAALVLAGSLGFFVAAGTVMTDPSLVFCTTLIMVAFWHAVSGKSRLWSYLFFVGCGLGLLAKGPVALVLTGIPIFLWVVMRKQWKPLWQRLPWITGTLLTLAIALPWYLMAEHRTPGFLNYFIIGENIGRFLDPSWKGDRYGFAHAYPYGMIWVFTLLGVLPWCLVLPFCHPERSEESQGVCRNIQRFFATFRMTVKKDEWLLYLILWTLATPVFFTFAANIIWPYGLMMIPGFALLFTEMWRRDTRFIPALASIAGVLGLVATIAFIACPEKFSGSQKDVIMAWQAEKPMSDSVLLFWGLHPQFSAEFYSGGRAKNTDDPALVKALLHNRTQDYIITNDDGFSSLPPDAQKKFKEVRRLTNGQGVRILLRETP